MEWGDEQHRHGGGVDQKGPDGAWRGAFREGHDPDLVAYQAVCSCGWRCKHERPVPPGPEDLPRDRRGDPYGPEWKRWCAAREAAYNACWKDWRVEHYRPLLGYDPRTQLILGEDDDGPRHFLDGHPVPNGATLELQIADGRWVPIQYWWSLDVEPGDSKPDPDLRLADVRIDLAFSAAARPLMPGPPTARFWMPQVAILRWPE